MGEIGNTSGPTVLTMALVVPETCGAGYSQVRRGERVWCGNLGHARTFEALGFEGGCMQWSGDLMLACSDAHGSALPLHCLCRTLEGRRGYFYIVSELRALGDFAKT